MRTLETVHAGREREREHTSKTTSRKLNPELSQTKVVKQVIIAK
jgi:hypothetical protein